jgi:hypothetical protein
MGLNGKLKGKHPRENQRSMGNISQSRTEEYGKRVRGGEGEGAEYVREQRGRTTVRYTSLWYRARQQLPLVRGKATAASGTGQGKQLPLVRGKGNSCLWYRARTTAASGTGQGKQLPLVQGKGQQLPLVRGKGNSCLWYRARTTAASGTGQGQQLPLVRGKISSCQLKDLHRTSQWETEQSAHLSRQLRSSSWPRPVPPAPGNSSGARTGGRRTPRRSGLWRQMTSGSVCRHWWRRTRRTAVGPRICADVQTLPGSRHTLPQSEGRQSSVQRMSMLLQQSSSAVQFLVQEDQMKLPWAQFVRHHAMGV